jgi:hypothetical protein
MPPTPDGLVEEDHAADEVGEAGRREQHLPIEAAVLPGVVDTEAREALGDRGMALVGGQDPLSGRNQCARNRLEGHGIHLHVSRRVPGPV